MEDINTTENAAPESVSTAPVTDTPQSAGPPTDFGSEMERTYDRIEAREGGKQSASPDTQNERARDISTPTDTPEVLPLPRSINGRINPDTWAALPKEAQELVLQREQEAQQKISQQGHELAELKRSGGMAGELASVLEHFTPNLPPHVAEMPRVQQIAALYAASEALDRDPVGSIRQLMAQYGLDPSQIGGSNSVPEEVTSQYAQYVFQMQRQYEQQAQQLQAQYQQQRHQRQQYLQEQIMEFVKDEAHSPELENEMVRQVEAVRATNARLWEADPMAVVKQAHSRALAITGVGTKQAQIEARKKADEAKRLASLNVRSVLGKSPTNVSKDIWSNDSWAASYDKAQRR